VIGALTARAPTRMYRRRDLVEIVKSCHCDVIVGSVGVVEDVRSDGYAVRLHGNFCDAGTVHTTRAQDRTVFFTEDQLKRPELKVQNEKIAQQLQRLQTELRAKKKK
jgi:hypothetical protein